MLNALTPNEVRFLTCLKRFHGTDLACFTVVFRLAANFTVLSFIRSSYFKLRSELFLENNFDVL